MSGLSGRLRVEAEDIGPGLRHAVYLELANGSPAPIAVGSPPEIRVELYDATGKPVSTMGLPASGPLPVRQWAVIPRDAYVGLRVDMQTVGVPTRERGLALIAVGGRTWAVGAGTYVLEAAAAFDCAEDAPANPWVGELALPPVEIVVTTRMFTPRR